MILTIALLLDIHSLEIHVAHTTRDSQAIPLIDTVQDFWSKLHMKPQMYLTPPRTHSISGLKSCVLKLIFLN